MSGKVVVLGAGDVALAVAARLALEGRDVLIWQDGSHPVADQLQERRRVRLRDAAGERVATLAGVTSDPFEALAAGDVLLSFVAPDARDVFNDLLLPLIEPRHMLVLLPGRLGGLAHARWLRDRGRGAGGLPTLVESDMMPCVCHRCGPNRVLVEAEVAHVGFGVFPADRTAGTLERIRWFFPEARGYAHLLAAALGSVEPLVRSATLLLNAGVEGCSGRRSLLYREGLSDHVVRFIEALDAERVAVAAALGLRMPPAAAALHAAGIAPDGDLWAALHGSCFLSRQRGPEPQERTRWLVQDVALGVRTWAELGDELGVRVPVAHALVALCDAVAGIDCWDAGRSLDELGIAGMTAETLARFLDSGDQEESA